MLAFLFGCPSWRRRHITNSIDSTSKQAKPTSKQTMPHFSLPARRLFMKVKCSVYVRRTIPFGYIGVECRATIEHQLEVFNIGYLCRLLLAACMGVWIGGTTDRRIHGVNGRTGVLSKQGLRSRSVRASSKTVRLPWVDAPRAS